MIGREVSRMQCHVGYGDQARTGCHAERDRAKMYMTEVGIHVKKKDGEWLVPFSNVTWCQFATDEVAPIKRGPGRPPKDAA